MNDERSTLPELLVRVLAHGCNHSDGLGSVSQTQWETLRIMVRQHRLGPLLHWRISQCDNSNNIPPDFADEIAASFRKHSLRSLGLQYEVARTQRVLREIGITGVFLKGAYLAFHAYPLPALRPLRDLDVLVPRDQAMAAFNALLTAGFTRLREFDGDPSAAVTGLKHLPPLMTPSGVTFELHTRLTAPHQMDLADDPAMWERLVHRDVAGERIAYLSPTDQLLHLIIHAVFDHRLNNGPLVLADIDSLLRRENIDWPLFWEMAAAGNWLRGCRLLLHLVDHFFGPLRFEAPPNGESPPLPGDAIAMACQLMLRDFVTTSDIQLAAELSATSISKRARILFDRLCPSRERILVRSASARSLHGTVSWYVAHWWRLATVRLPSYLATSRLHEGADDTIALTRLNRWLAE
jgi:hypothetical protein